jgi:hypothetical protein
MSVGYTFNQKPESSSLVKLTLSAQNVLTITKYDGLDPEILWYYNTYILDHYFHVRFKR